MAKRRLLLEVDCGKRRCKRCAHVGCGPEPYCEPFDADCQLDERGRPMRLPACLEAEFPDVPSAEQLSRWRAVADYVNGGGIAHYEREMSRALLEAADFVDAVRRAVEHPPVASREVPADLSSMWGDVKCEPITYTFEAKVKP